MATQAFDGGTTGSFTLESSTSSIYVEDRVLWNRGNLDLAGQYRVKIDSISPTDASGWNYYRINVGGANYAAGSVVVNQNTTVAYVRLYNDSGTAYVDRDNADGVLDDFIKQYKQSDGSLNYTWDPGALAGSYSWSTVATAPGIGTPSVDKQSITVTYTNSASNGDSAITAYKMQYSSNNGSTWSTAVTVTGNTKTFTDLEPDTVYKFRVYATNGVGDSAASVSAEVATEPAARGRIYVDGAWRDAEIARRYDGTNWVDVEVFRRYNGSSWVDLT